MRLNLRMQAGQALNVRFIENDPGPTVIGEGYALPVKLIVRIDNNRFGDETLIMMLVFIPVEFEGLV